MRIGLYVLCGEECPLAGIQRRSTEAVGQWRPLGVALGGATRYPHDMERITINPAVCGGQPTVRGLRIPVGLIVRHVAHGQTPEQIVREYPELELEDIRQALLYAAWAASGRSESIA